MPFIRVFQRELAFYNAFALLCNTMNVKSILLLTIINNPFFFSSFQHLPHLIDPPRGTEFMGMIKLHM